MTELGAASTSVIVRGQRPICVVAVNGQGMRNVGEAAGARVRDAATVRADAKPFRGNFKREMRAVRTDPTTPHC